MKAYGQRELKKGDAGEDVVELQIRLAGFRGTIPDGKFGPGTELQVVKFQHDYMNQMYPSGIVDQKTFDAITQFARNYPFDFEALKCPCGMCGGFGEKRFKDYYEPGRPRTEASHRYEYPGIHRMLLWAVRGLFHYTPALKYVITSGYRCSIDNQNKKRTSTNHHGKAIDLDVILTRDRISKRDEMDCIEQIRGLLVTQANAQIGWAGRNRKSLEPSSIAPTWIHYDVRTYETTYLADRFFCKSLKELDGNEGE